MAGYKRSRSRPRSRSIRRKHGAPKRSRSHRGGKRRSRSGRKPSGIRRRSRSFRSKGLKRGGSAMYGGTYGTSASLDYAPSPYLSGGNKGYDDDSYGDYNQGKSSQGSYNQGSYNQGNTDPEVQKLSKNISQVIADLRAKLRRSTDQGSYGHSGSSGSSYLNKDSGKDSGKSDSDSGWFGSGSWFGKGDSDNAKEKIPKHYGGFHRSSFLNRLRRR